jgi:hypothetical protein
MSERLKQSGGFRCIRDVPVANVYFVRDNQTGGTSMNEILTIDEIKTRYPSEHVLLEDPQTNPDHEVLGGRVLWHSADQEEVYRKAIELRPKRAAYVYTGTIPDDTIYIL